MLHPLLEKQKKIASEFCQLEALHELRQAGVALPEKYQQILDRKLQLQTSMSKQPQHLKRLISKRIAV
jgi:restriction endonuclease S subunit